LDFGLGYETAPFLQVWWSINTLPPELMKILTPYPMKEMIKKLQNLAAQLGLELWAFLQHKTEDKLAKGGHMRSMQA